MQSIKKSIAILLLNVVLFTATSAVAHDIDITISGLYRDDLAAFDLNVIYDDVLLTFDSCILTQALGSFTDPADAPDADDWSRGDDAFGTVNLSVLSYLSDFSSQPDAFTLATLSFSGEESVMDAIHLSDVVLSDAYGKPIRFTVSGTNIYTPLPSAFWLLCSGLGIAGIGRQLKKNSPSISTIS